jgi:hypothetical protein
MPMRSRSERASGVTTSVGGHGYHSKATAVDPLAGRRQAVQRMPSRARRCFAVIVEIRYLVVGCPSPSGSSRYVPHLRQHPAQADWFPRSDAADHASGTSAWATPISAAGSTRPARRRLVGRQQLKLPTAGRCAERAAGGFALCAGAACRRGRAGTAECGAAEEAEG